MYYRYEVRRSANDPWEGCFQYLFPDQRRFLGRWIKEPKWYQNHPFTIPVAGLHRKASKNTGILWRK